MLQQVFDPEGAFNQASLVLLHPFSTAICIAVFLLAALLVWLAIRNSRSLSFKRRAFLVGLRVVTLLLLLGFFLQPGLRLEQVSRMRDHVAVLLDLSRSMSLPGEGRQSRMESAIETLRESDTWATWQREHQVDVYAFDRKLSPLPQEVSEALQAPKKLDPPMGEATDIQSALQALDVRYQPQDLAAVLLVSDGSDNASLKGATEPTASLRATAEALGAPIHALFTGPKDPPKDVALLHVQHDSFAFVRNALTIEADVQVQGYKDIALPVTLYQGEKPIQSRLLRVTEGQSNYHFDFEFVPDLLGKDLFTLEVGQAPDETIVENNRQSFSIQVLRDKIRVLQVVGRPSWDERFLRKLLEENPNVDLISFFILRTNESIDPTRSDELSLIPFPTDELFHEQLGSFDLVIFQNFSYRGYRMRQYLPEIRDYVQNGGGFLMIGGDLAFASGGYSDTPIAQILPFELPSGKTDLIDTARFTPRLTEAGLHHPITQITGDRGEALRQAWEGLPMLTGINRTAGLKSDAIVLLEHPDLTAGGAPEPVMTVRNYGLGRVLTLTTDTTWHWGFQSFAQGGDSRAYYRLFGNAIRWLCRDPALQPMQVKADRDRYALGSEGSMQLRLTSDDGAPIEGSEVTFRVFEFKGESHANPLGSEGGMPIWTETAKTDAQGTAFARFKAEKEGTYELVAEATRGDEVIFASDLFVVAANPLELSETKANSDVLKAVTTAGGGELRSLKQGIDDLPLKQAAVLRVNRRHDVPLWSHWIWLLLAVLFPCMEWGFRRHYGLL